MLSEVAYFLHLPNRSTHTIASHAKTNYPCVRLQQIWYHRRALLETYGARDFMEEELAYIEEVLGIDSKNYHAWSYRQWILMTVDDDSIWEKEMGFGR